MHSALIVLGLASIFLLSMGFLLLAFLMNRQWTREAAPRRATDDDE